MTGKEIQDRGNLKTLDADMRFSTTTDPNYVFKKRKVVLPAMKWKVLAVSTADEDKPQESTADEPKEFKFSADSYQNGFPWGTQIGGSAFVSGNAKAKKLQRNQNHIPWVASLFLGKHW